MDSSPAWPFDDFVIVNSTKTQQLPYRGRSNVVHSRREESIQSDDDIEHLSGPPSVHSFDSPSPSILSLNDEADANANGPIVPCASACSEHPVRPSDAANSAKQTLDVSLTEQMHRLTAADQPPIHNIQGGQRRASFMRSRDASDCHARVTRPITPNSDDSSDRQAPQATSEALDLTFHPSPFQEGRLYRSCRTHVELDSHLICLLIDHAFESPRKSRPYTANEQSLRDSLTARLETLPNDHPVIQTAARQLRSDRERLKSHFWNNRNLSHVWNLLFSGIERSAVLALSQCHACDFQTKCLLNRLVVLASSGRTMTDHSKDPPEACQLALSVQAECIQGVGNINSDFALLSRDIYPNVKAGIENNAAFMRIANAPRNMQLQNTAFRHELFDTTHATSSPEHDCSYLQRAWLDHAQNSIRLVFSSPNSTNPIKREAPEEWPTMDPHPMSPPKKRPGLSHKSSPDKRAVPTHKFLDPSDVGKGLTITNELKQATSPPDGPPTASDDRARRTGQTRDTFHGMASTSLTNSSTTTTTSLSDYHLQLLSLERANKKRSEDIDRFLIGHVDWLCAKVPGTQQVQCTLVAKTGYFPCGRILSSDTVWRRHMKTDHSDWLNFISFDEAGKMRSGSEKVEIASKYCQQDNAVFSFPTGHFQGTFENVEVVSEPSLATGSFIGSGRLPERGNPQTSYVRYGQDNVLWLAFEHVNWINSITMEYTIRCDIQSIELSMMSQNFIQRHFVFDQDQAQEPALATGNPFRDLNEMACALASLNPCLEVGSIGSDARLLRQATLHVHKLDVLQRGVHFCRSELPLIRRNTKGIHWLAFVDRTMNSEVHYARCDISHISSVEVLSLASDQRRLYVCPEPCQFVVHCNNTNAKRCTYHTGHLGWALAQRNAELLPGSKLLQQAVDSYVQVTGA